MYPSPYPLCSKKNFWSFFGSCCSCSCFLILIFPFFAGKQQLAIIFVVLLSTSTISNIFLFPLTVLEVRKEVVNLLFALADNTTEKVKLLGSCSKIPLFHQCWHVSNPTCKQNKKSELAFAV